MKQTHKKFGLGAVATAVLGLAMSIGSSAHAQVAVDQLSDQAPEIYTVVKGDTLWDISGKFLKSPWKWPNLWEANKSVVADPHLIYPGDVLVLQIVDGKATVALARTGKPRGVVNLKPGIRIEDQVLDSSGAVSTINYEAIKHFLSKPILVTKNELDSAPRIISGSEGRTFIGSGSKVFAVGMDETSTGEYSIYRQGAPLVNPENGQVLAYEAVHLGEAEVQKHGEVSQLFLKNSNQEITKGDRLVRVENEQEITAQIKQAPADFSGQIIRIFDGNSSSLMTELGMDLRTYEKEGGPLSIVVINRGTKDNVEVGTAIQMMSAGAIVGRPSPTNFRNGKPVEKPVRLPDETNGQAVVFQAFENISYALVLTAERSVKAGDKLIAP